VSIAKVRGTRDLLPDDMIALQRVEQAAHDVFARFGYGEIRTPMFERTELFVRGIGEGTDIVSKEMYTFEDRGGRSITLRPEGTAGVVRACLEQNLFKQCPVQKLYYVGPMFRYERPQAGRYREFWQAGIEAFGVSDAIIDAETLVCAYEFVSELGIKPVEIRLNSIGNEERPAYIEKLQEYIRPHLDEMGGRDKERFEANPLRMLDSKDERMRELLADAPKIGDHLSPESVEHFEAVRRLLDKANVPYVVDPLIVRGLDYYTRTVFEVTTVGLGAQDAILAGGRYDDLVSEVGGQSVPGIGFAAGLDRLILAMREQNVDVDERPKHDVYVVTIGDQAREAAFEALTALRRLGTRAEMDHQGRSVRAQMKTANQLGVPYVVVLGEDELARQEATVRDMGDQSQETVPLTELAARLSARTNP
jgi:histidyl-tRNA synthetase